MRKKSRAVVSLFLLCVSASPATAAERFDSEPAAQQHCPDDTVVWLNLRSGNIHIRDTKWYGRTQSGAYVCRKELGQGKARTAGSDEAGKASAWRKVAEDGTRTVYAGTAPLEKAGDRVTIVSLVDLRKATALSEGKEFLSWETQYEFDCKSVRSRIVAASMYSGNMGKGEVTDSVVYEAPEWKPIPAGSNGEALWKVACGKE